MVSSGPSLEQAPPHHIGCRLRGCRAMRFCYLIPSLPGILFWEMHQTKSEPFFPALYLPSMSNSTPAQPVLLSQKAPNASEICVVGLHCNHIKLR